MCHITCLFAADADPHTPSSAESALIHLVGVQDCGPDGKALGGVTMKLMDEVGCEKLAYKELNSGWNSLLAKIRDFELQSQIASETKS